VKESHTDYYRTTDAGPNTDLLIRSLRLRHVNLNCKVIVSFNILAEEPTSSLDRQILAKAINRTEE
jgi:hypothetical protein